MLTANQRRALEFRHHIAVTANAGAGKTTVLVRRFVEIFRQTDVRVREIAAITFTEKAAGELKKKISDHVSQLLKTDLRPEERRRFEELRDQLAGAHIGTIHSFCAGILREFPVEADVDAAFTVLDGIDRQQCEEEAVRESLDDILRGRYETGLRNDVLDVVRILGRQALPGYLTGFLRNREHIERLLAPDALLAEERSDESIIRHWDLTIMDSLRSHAGDPEFLAMLARLVGIARGKRAGSAKELFNEFRTCRDAERKVELYGEIVDLLLTTAGTFRKDVAGTGCDESSVVPALRFVARHRHGVRDLLNAIRHPDGSEAQAVLLRTTRRLLMIYSRAILLYNAKKAERGQLDFEDLQLKTLALLSREDMRTRIGKRFRFIMVDEYQDTNRLQYDILLQLLSRFRSGNLFIVGDPKQSIYGFRHAEVEIFETTKRDIDQVVRDAAGPSPADEPQALVTLPESFRLLLQPLAFVNTVFRATMTDGGRTDEVPFVELVKGRSNDAPGRVEIMLLPDQEGKDGNGPIRAECGMIAARLRHLVTSGFEVFDLKSEHPHPIRYKECAVLLRSRTHLREMERVFQDWNLPYVLTGGIGFYQTQEVYDFLNYFSFLLNVENDVALVGILRSTFFLLSDADLYQIALVPGRGSFWSKLQEASSGTGAAPHIARAVRILRLSLALANRVSIPLLVYRIFRETGWQGAVAGLSSGGQHAANIEKLVRLAREFEGKGYTTLYDFVLRLRQLVDSQEREGQATIERGGNSIQIMTIHAAKGLEFPAVIIPFTHTPFRYDKPPYIDPHVGLGMLLADPRNLDRELRAPLYEYLRYRSVKKTEAEEKRIFYVASTRARDLLILSGRHDPEVARPSYLRWTLDALGVGDLTLSASRRLSIPVEVSVVAPGGEPTAGNVVRSDLHVDILTSVPEISYAKEKESACEGWDAPESIYLAPLRTQTRGEFFSATQVRTYLECPTKYYLKYRLGIPEPDGIPFDFDELEEANDKILGELEGSITHALLQRIPGPDVSDRWVGDAADRLVRASSFASEEHMTILAKSVKRNVQNVLASPFGKALLSSTEAMSEYTINRIFGNHYLTGTIDRLYRDAEGKWCIVDYKTDALDPTAIRERAELHRTQLLFYALLVSGLFGQPMVRASVFFVSLTDSLVHFTFMEQEVAAFSAQLEDVTRNIENGFFRRNVIECPTCPYRKKGKCLVL